MPPRKKAKDASIPDEAPTKVVTVAKPKLRVARGCRGCLKNIPNMPLDILFEIFCFLHPRDLLNFARASKALRAILMNRKHAYCWKTARAQLGDEYPETPAYLSEPAYADLLFFHHCYNCKKNNIRKVYWAFSARYCKTCFDVMSCSFPQSLVTEVRAELEDLSDSAFLNWHWNEYRVRDPRHEKLAHKPEVEAFEKMWKALSDVADKRRFIEERQGNVEAARLTHLTLWGQSEKARLENRSGMKVEREARLRAVEDRLRADGWGEELYFMRQEKKIQELSNHKDVFKQTKLTDDEWDNMRDDIMAIVHPYREALRQSNARKKLFKKRLRRLTTAYNDHLRAGGSLTRKYTAVDEQMATVCDLTYLPEIRTLIEAAPDKEISEATFVPLIRECMEKWTAERKTVFEEKARRALKKNPAAQVPEILDLAIVSFHCTVDQCPVPTPIRWPDILAHPCFRPMPFSNVEGLKDEFDHVICWQFGRDHFMAEEKQVVFNKHVKEVREVISCCGEDPTAVTYKTMEECPFRLACGKCGTPDRREAFDWLGAVSHAVQHHRSDYTDWQRVSGADAVKAKELAEVLHQESVKQAYSQPLARLACAWCSERDLYGDEDAYDEMIDHVQICHDIEEPVVDVDLYMPIDMRARGTPPVIMFTSALVDDPDVKLQVEKGKGFFRTYALA